MAISVGLQILIFRKGMPIGSSGKKTNGNLMLVGKPEKGSYYTNGVMYVRSLYSRIFIRRIKTEN